MFKRCSLTLCVSTPTQIFLKGRPLKLSSGMGIALCGSGNGVCMTVNKHQGIRGALCWSVEIAWLARLHNNANVCCLPARFISYEDAQDIVERFLTTEFEGGRHQRRVEKIPVTSH